MTLPPGKFAAFLFDCDGTIADSMPLHFRAWQEALAPHGASFPRELFLAWAGIPVPRTVELLNEKYGLTMLPEAVAQAREEAYLSLLPQVKAVPEVLAAILEHHGRIPFAVVSGSPRASVIRTLDFLELTPRFETLVGGDDSARGKPHPDPFLLAASRLGVRPEECLVFEDADLGIAAAKAASMRWVRVASRM